MMVMFGLHLVSIVVWFIPIINGYLGIDEVTSEYGKQINHFVEKIIEEDTCGGVISEEAEPRDAGTAAHLLNRNDCFMCNGICYTMDDLMNDVGSGVDCSVLRRIRRRPRRLCQVYADILNEQGQCDGGFYRCYREDVHASLGLSTSTPVCVCGGSNGINCISSFVQKKKCTVAVQGSNKKECDCLVKVNLLL